MNNIISEPACLHEKREEGLALYEQLPVPSLPSRERTFPIFYPAQLPTRAGSAPAAKVESTNPNVVVLSLEKAFETHSKPIETYFGKILPANQNKWIALNQAYWDEGTFILVPKNSNSTISIEHTQQENHLVFLPRILIIVENGSRVNILNSYHSHLTQPAFVAPVVEIFAGENSEVHYAEIQEWGPETHHLSAEKIIASGDSRITITTCMFGGRRTVHNTQVSLQGQGSRAQLFGLALGHGEQVFEHYTLQEHKAPLTESDLLFKVALQDKAYSHFDGLIWIEKGAQKTNAYQQNRNLLLSPHAKADTTPRLEILDNDVRCTHGATVGPVDEEQRFYLESRGVAPEQAEGLIVEGFFEQVLSRLPSETLKERLQSKLQTYFKMEGLHGKLD